VGAWADFAAIPEMLKLINNLYRSIVISLIIG